MAGDNKHTYGMLRVEREKEESNKEDEVKTKRDKDVTGTVLKIAMLVLVVTWIFAPNTLYKDYGLLSAPVIEDGSRGWEYYGEVEDLSDYDLRIQADSDIDIVVGVPDELLEKMLNDTILPYKGKILDNGNDIIRIDDYILSMSLGDKVISSTNFTISNITMEDKLAYKMEYGK